MIKRILFALILSILLVNCKSNSNIVTSKEEAIEKGIYEYETDSKKKTSKKKSNRKKSTTYTAVPNLNKKIVNDALDNVGVKYRLGGTNKKGMDCSGLVFSTYENYDIRLPRTSTDMSRHGKVIKTKEALPGDLIFFKTNGRSVINHVGIITEINGETITFVHASTSKGVIISSTDDEYYSKTFAQINRVIN